MRVRSVFFACFFILTAPAHAEDSAALDQCHGQNPYFPLLAGGSWTYRTHTESLDEGTWDGTAVASFSRRAPEIGAAAVGVMITRFDVPGATTTSRDEYSLSEGAVIKRPLGGETTFQSQPGYKVESSPGLPGVLLPPVPALATGAVWKVKHRDVTGYAGDSQQFTLSAVTDYAADARRSETIVTAAGRFRALKVEGVTDGSVEEVEPVVGRAQTVETSWYAPGVGLVKSEIRAGSFRSSSELQSFELPSCCAFVVLESEGATMSDGGRLQAGDTLSASSGINVAPGGRVELGKANGLSVTLYEGEHGLSLDCPGATAGIFKTIIGKARYWNAKFWSSGSGDVWETNTAWAGVRGTIFTIESVRTKRGYKTIVDVEDGEVELKSRDGARVLRLKAGERGEI
ncbi:MAG: hypothetical protein HXY23_05560 [Parvularculaceae bacterium]|nr:hypothetical protein [Parvularculaceae bacterium]